MSTKRKARRLPPDPEGMNEDRADWAEDALNTFANEHGETLEPGATAAEIAEMTTQNLADLLADLAHFCDRHNVSFSQCLNTAEMHYDAETDSKGKQFAPAPALPRVVVTIEGGNVQSLVSDEPVAVAVIDFDTDSLDEDLTAIPQGDGKSAEARASIQYATPSAARVAELFDVINAAPDKDEICNECGYLLGRCNCERCPTCHLLLSACECR